MHHSGFRRLTAAAAIVALGAVTLFGCSTLPSAPVAAPRAANLESMLLRAPHEAAPASGSLSASTTTFEQTEKSIDGITGGSVRAGRFTVEVPAGAITGTGDITVEVPDTTALRVDLHIKNAPNEFRIPVTLEVSFKGFEGSPDADPAYFKIFWYDEAAVVWRMLPTEVDLERGTVSTRLEHFSTYGVLEAKAGW